MSQNQTQTETRKQQQQQLAELNRQALEAAHQLTLASVRGFEKLMQLNTQALRATLEDNLARSRSLLELQDTRSLNEALSGSMAPSADRVAAYTQHVFNISQETAAELQQIIEKQFNDTSLQLNTAMDALSKAVPGNFDSLVPLVKNVVDSANTAFEQLNKATRQMVEVVEKQGSKAEAQPAKDPKPSPAPATPASSRSK